MKHSQNQESTLFVDFIPAELRKNKTWEIIYYVKNPYTGKLARKRNRVKPLKNKTARLKLARTMVSNINSRLEKGWNPFFQNKGTKELTKFLDVTRIFCDRVKYEVKDGNLRYDTLKTYLSQINKLEQYITDVVQEPDLMVYKFDNNFVGDYLDHVRYVLGRSAVTRDNYLTFLKLFSNFLLEKRYITANPTTGFSKINKKEKRRTIIDKETLQAIFMYWDNNCPGYSLLCKVTYYCFIRATEMTKLTIGDFNLDKGTVWLDSHISKNRKGNIVTIPNILIKELRKHFDGKEEHMLVFSGKEFKPGDKKIWPQRINENWLIMRNEIGLDKNMHWYSLKDSGITHMLEAGVPIIAVRDQARHHHLNQTDTYTPRSIKKSNENIRSIQL